MANWKKLPAVDGSVSCLTCGCGAGSDLDPDRMIAVGFGDAGYSKDGDSVSLEDAPQPRFVSDVEVLAKADPDHDWRIYFFAPLYEAEYQRQGDDLWVLIKKGMGFA